MSLPELGIKRNVMAYMFMFAIIVFGLVGYFKLSVEQFPNVDFPAIVVVTTYAGTDSETIDNVISSIILEQLNGITGLDYIGSTSRPGLSTIIIVFKLNKNIDVAFNEVQAKIAQARINLPTDVDTPQAYKASSSDNPFFRMVLYGDRTITQLNTYADETIKKKIVNISGISEITLSGRADRIMRIALDTYKLASYSLGINDVIRVVQSSQTQASGGYIVRNNNELLLKLNFESSTPDEFKNIVLKNHNGSLIRLSDVAIVSNAETDFRTYASYNDQRAIALDITKIAGASIFTINDELIKRLNEDIVPQLDPGLNLTITTNTVSDVQVAIHNLEEHIVVGTILAAIVVLLFLRSFVATIIVALSIPLSLLGAVLVMYFLDYTFNTITLLALLLLIGVVVDDAIIVIENIHRKMEEGMPANQAAIVGTNQILFAVMAATLSLVAIFGPVVFMDGIMGKFFKSFAVVVTAGVMISFFVSLFITPMLSSRFLKISHHKGKIDRSLEYVLVGLENIYRKSLAFALNYRFIMIIIAVLTFMSSFLILPKIPGEFTVEDDTSELRVNFKTPVGSNIYYSIEKQKELSSIIVKHKEVIGIYASVGAGGTTDGGHLIVNLVPHDQRKISQKDFIKMLRSELTGLVGVTANVGGVGGDPSGGGGGYKLEFNLVGSNLQELYENALKLQDALENKNGIGAVDLSYSLLPQLKFTMNKDKVALLGLTPREVSQAISVTVGGNNIGKFNDVNGNKRYNIRLKGTDSQFSSVDDLKNIYLRSPISGLIRLDSVVTAEEYLSFSRVERYGLLYSVGIRSNTDLDLVSATKVFNDTASKLLPPGYELLPQGSSRALNDSLKSVGLTFALAILLLYVVLASQFNSFIQPLVLLVSIPLAFVGSFYGIYLTGLSLNIFSMIGIILLVGLVAKNAILLIDFTNELRFAGKNIKEALLEACPVRLRPILMTSLTVIFSMLPSMFSSGPGSGNNASMSIAIIGGMISSTILTLLVIPAIYSLVEGALEKFAKRKNGKKLVEVNKH